MLAGASGSGKTSWLEKLLSHFNNITDGSTTKYERLLWFSANNQPELFQRVKIKREEHLLRYFSSKKGITMLAKEGPKGDLIATPSAWSKGLP